MNLESIIYGRRKWIVYGMIGVAFIVAFVAITDTVQLFSKYLELKKELGAIEPAHIDDRTLAPMHGFKDINLNRIVFESVGDAAKTSNVRVKKINMPSIYEEEGHLMLSEEVILEGSFTNVLHCMDLADEKLGPVKITSLKFQRERSLKSNSLLLNVHFQIVKANDAK